MDHGPTMLESFVKLEHPDALDYMTSFDSTVDPQLGLFEESDSGAASQQMMNGILWNNPFDVTTGCLADMQDAAGDDPMTTQSELNSSPDVPAEPLTPRSSTRSSPDKTLSQSQKDMPPAKKTRRAVKVATQQAAGEAPAPNDAGPRARRKSSARKASRKAEDDENENESDKTKRTQSLKRNRIAASKCRQKKKEWQQSLEGQKSDLESQHKMLQHEYTELLEEVTQMKNHLMNHAGCEDPNIDAWIETEAKKFVERSGAHAAVWLPEDSRASISGGSSVAMTHSRNDSFITQESPSSSLEAGMPSPPDQQIKDEGINYDHMPDDMFDDINL